MSNEEWGNIEYWPRVSVVRDGWVSCDGANGALVWSTYGQNKNKEESCSSHQKLFSEPQKSNPPLKCFLLIVWLWCERAESTKAVSTILCFCCSLLMHTGGCHFPLSHMCLPFQSSHLHIATLFSPQQFLHCIRMFGSVSPSIPTRNAYLCSGQVRLVNQF